MVWEFAGALERNYDRWDVNPKYDKNGKRVFKTRRNNNTKGYHNHVYYKKSVNNGAKYDPNTHEGYEF